MRFDHDDIREYLRAWYTIHPDEPPFQLERRRGEATAEVDAFLRAYAMVICRRMLAEYGINQSPMDRKP